MRLWIVLQIKSEKIGSKQVLTDEYNEYLDKLRRYEEAYGDSIGWFSGKPIEPENQYKRVPINFNIPRIIEISPTDVNEKYAGRLATDDNWMWNKDLVWIEEVEIDEIGKVLEKLSLNFKG